MNYAIALAQNIHVDWHVMHSRGATHIVGATSSCSCCACTILCIKCQSAVSIGMSCWASCPNLRCGCNVFHRNVRCNIVVWLLRSICCMRNGAGWRTVGKIRRNWSVRTECDFVRTFLRTTPKSHSKLHLNYCAKDRNAIWKEMQQNVRSGIVLRFGIFGILHSFFIFISKVRNN